MATAKEEIIHDQMFGGMTRGVRDHLIGPSQWRTSFGMRHFETQVRQPLRRKEMYSVLSNHNYPLSLLVSVPVGYENFGTLVGLTDSGVFRLTSSGATRLGRPDGSALLLVADGTIRRFGHTLYNNRLLFVNPLNRVQTTDGTLVREIDNSPAGQYVETFFEHVVVGRPIFNGAESPYRFQWSGLYNFAEWTPASHTEADHFDCVEHQNDEGYSGITGLRRLGPLLCVYTPSAIYVGRYVGLPRVIVTDAVVQDYGNGLPWSLAAVDRSHFFIDTREQSFFRFDGGEVSEIGAPIKAYFFTDLSTTQAYRLRTYAYVDPLYKEIHWVYVSTASSGGFDREVVFNYRSGTWWAGPVEDVWSFCRGTRRTRTVDELSSTIDAQTGSIDTLSEATDVLGRVYGSRNGRLLREEVSADTTASLLEQTPVPHLETGDVHYGDIQNHKEVESMTIHSGYVDAAGVDVFAASRHHIDDTVTLNQQSQTWTPALAEQRLSLPRFSGRIFRYKFTPKVTSSTTVTETRTPPTNGFSLLAQIPAITPPPPPQVDLLWGFSSDGPYPSVHYEWTLTFPSGSNRGTFMWLYARRQGVPFSTPTLLVDGVAATLVTTFLADGLENTAAYLFYLTNSPTGSKVISVDWAGVGGTLWVFHAHIVGVCVSGVAQTSPIVNLQTSRNVVNNAFSFPNSANYILLSGLIVNTFADAAGIPQPTPVTGSAYSATIFKTGSAGVDPAPYMVYGLAGLGHRLGDAPGTAIGWVQNEAAVDTCEWWNIAVALKGA